MIAHKIIINCFNFNYYQRLYPLTEFLYRDYHFNAPSTSSKSYLYTLSSLFSPHKNWRKKKQLMRMEIVLFINSFTPKKIKQFPITPLRLTIKYIQKLWMLKFLWCCCWDSTVNFFLFVISAPSGAIKPEYLCKTRKYKVNVSSGRVARMTINGRLFRKWGTSFSEVILSGGLYPSKHVSV